MQAEKNRAAIWEVDRATGRWRIFADGLRNPNGLSWEPESGMLWTVVNERDELGPNLVPDYTSRQRLKGAQAMLTVPTMPQPRSRSRNATDNRTARKRMSANRQRLKARLFWSLRLSHYYAIETTQ